MNKKRRIKLPDRLGKLLVPKKGSKIEKLQKRYSEDEFSLTSVMTSDGEPLGFLLRKLDKTKKPVKKKTKIKKKTA